MLERPIITLTTDFGLKDPFVGTMKGVILGINPAAQIIDISHNVSPHDILEASQIISMSYKYFPSTSIHVVVVDPGVGGIRKPLLVVTENHYFIGPDNGVFTLIFEKESTNNLFKVIHITSSHYFLRNRSSTFHGRDIFAPAAAWLSKGIDSFKFGEQIDDYVTISMPKTKSHGENAIEGEVIHIDSFGNATTSITKDDIDKLCPDPSKENLKVIYKNEQLKLLNYYSETGDSDLSAVINAFGFLELFIYRGNAFHQFGIKKGDPVNITII